MKKDSFSRREFLGMGAAVGGATLAAKTIFLDPEPLFASLQAVAPSDRVRFGMIGIGMQGSGLLANAIELPGVECVKACDLYDGRHTLAREITAKPTLPVTRRYQDLLADKEIDCIVAAVPDHWHKQLVVDTVSAGKNNFWGKSTCHTPAAGVGRSHGAEATSRNVQMRSRGGS